MLTAEIKDADGKVVGIVVLAEKTFSTGSKGHFGTAKVFVGGRNCQVQVQSVIIGSKTAK